MDQVAINIVRGYILENLDKGDKAATTASEVCSDGSNRGY